MTETNPEQLLERDARKRCVVIGHKSKTPLSEPMGFTYIEYSVSQMKAEAGHQVHGTLYTIIH